MQPGEDIKSIIVVGGGSAGYISALYLKKTFPHMDVSVVASSKIPVIGVGEATTPQLRDFLHRKMGFRLQEFFQEAKPTFKLGVKFVWGQPGEYHFNNPFGPQDVSNSLHHTGSLNNMSLTSMLMDADRLPFVSMADKVKPLRLSRGYAYHVDNQHFLRYLQGKLHAEGCRYEDAEIERVELNATHSDVAGLVIRDGRTLRADLFVDCSGFRSMLLGGALGERWVDYSASLKTNRAIVGTRPNDGELKPYTTSTTLKHGWLWNTPMQHEDHLGYVFSSEHCTDEEAREELRTHCKTINHERVIQFKPGRYAQSWRGNVVGIGNSFAFVEPLESTGLHMILRQLRLLTSGLKTQEALDAQQQKYNQRTNGMWDSLRYYIALHFKLNARMDTPFWRACREEADVSGLEPYLEYYHSHGPLGFDEEHCLYGELGVDATFSVFSYDIVAAGCGVRQESFVEDARRLSALWPKRFEIDRQVVRQCLKHREALRYMESYDHDFLAADEIVA